MQRFFSKTAILLLVLAVSFNRSAYAEPSGSWHSTISESGDCRISFPSEPQMTQQTLTIPESGDKLLYDVYLAPFEDKGICLLLIAQYPFAVEQESVRNGLEGLLRGILGHSPDNQLIFAKVTQVEGSAGIDFLVDSRENYFRGLAFMVGNRLYLIAMEGRKEMRSEKTFVRFSKSFQKLSIKDGL